RLMIYLRTAERTCIRTFGKPLFFSRGLEEKWTDVETWNRTISRIAFSDEEHRRGNQLLERLGLTPFGYVCLHTRDSAYALSAYPKLWAERRRAGPGVDSVGVSRTIKLENSNYNRYRSARFADFGESLSVLQREAVAGVRLGAKVERDYTGD